MNLQQQSRQHKQHLILQVTHFAIQLSYPINSNFLQKYSKLALKNEIKARRNEPNAKEPI